MRIRIVLPLTLVLLAGCAAEKPRPPPERAPAAKRPELAAIFRMNQRPTRQSGDLEVGSATEMKPCTGNPRQYGMQPPLGVLFRVNAPVPTDLRVELVTPIGSRRVVTPEDLDDEVRLVKRGEPYLYENQLITHATPTGQIAAREIYIAPGEYAPKGIFNVQIRTQSFDPQAFGEDKESQPIVIPVVGKCPDFEVSIEPTKVSVMRGASIRWKVLMTPSGDGVGELPVELSITGLPKGITATLRDTTLQGTSWSDPRETRLDLTPGLDAPLGEHKVTVRARLGTLIRVATETMKVLPVPTVD
ncbi:MAG: hypothetical protein JST92_01275 [Deltaproteobacteria bacterium]|nr:hypothetical protein [Deltaproteobacteria bacterium]